MIYLKPTKMSMKKNYALLITLLVTISGNAQSGINTKNPNASLEVNATTDNTKADGIMAPRVTKSNLISKTGVYSTPQTSAIVYVTDASATSTDAKFTSIDAVGYYYFDGLVWVKMRYVPEPIYKWDLNGNAITDGQFLGTTNNQTLQFKYNNLNAGFINNKNTSYGADALPFTTSVTGIGNVAFGIEVLKANTTGSNNAAIGNLALVNNTTGVNNVAVGYNTLNTNVVGDFNVAIGANALSKNEGPNSNNNTAVGNNALANNTTSGNNTAVGSNAATANTVGNLNTAIGRDALASNINSNSNTAVGSSALSKNTVANNTGIGSSAFPANSSGSANTGLGFRAGYVNTTGSNNVALGAHSLLGNTTGSRNIAIGQNSMTSSDVASDIVAIGNSSFNFLKNTTGNDYNTALGSGSGKIIVTGTNNTFIGGNTSGGAISNNSTVVGAGSTIGVTSLNYATALGSDAIVTQSNSVILGRTNDSVGVGTTAPSNKLHVVATTHPIRLEGLQTASSILPVLVVDENGVIYKSGVLNTFAAPSTTVTTDFNEINILKATVEEQGKQIEDIKKENESLKIQLQSIINALENKPLN